ncbi:hypothetical protein FXN63_26265 [Pigmentiphaga aceris]|uniref:Uncharacterized protein n=1 Tax=Pigmentiphaga aceris TaxID=1940612 RepID=A0A5C0B2Z6_9BURK|nr:hypothetical protein [Pigmentiphaga aceris]QEI08962.1 hypothetical protein FXN63_26265 [Pigmentiphaga aceris]
MYFPHVPRLAAIALLAATASGCASWSTSSVDGVRRPAARPATLPAEVVLSESDMADRKYLRLGDITVTVNKTSAFNATPTREMVNVKLQEKGAELGADAVIFVRYGDLDFSMFSWGTLEGKGRAIKFVP